MGMDAHAFMAIGFEITEEDFLVTVRPDKVTCAHGHPKPDGSRAKFCPEDGTKYDQYEVTSPTERMDSLLSLLEIDMFDPNDFDGEFDDIEQWWNVYLASEGEPFIKVGVNEDTLILGKLIGDTGSHRFNLTTVEQSREEVDEAWAEVRDMRTALGFDPKERPIRLYSWMHISC